MLAHPDDEAIATGGVMAKAASEGHRVVLVTATRGERGEIQPGVLGDGEELWERRVKEVAEAAALLGASRQVFLGYVDSGMMGTPDNDDPASFWQADVDEAAGRLAAILTEESADVLTVYDAHGNYGHPDHIQVHRVGIRAAELAGVTEVYEATIDRDRMRSQLEDVVSGESPFADGPMLVLAEEMLKEADAFDMGMPAEVITTHVDVTAFLPQKRAALRVHASQVGADSFFLAMPDEAFAMAFGNEAFIHRGAPAGASEDRII
jgi:LmbE family N-acetylglucosaminyl deacetylase